MKRIITLLVVAMTLMGMQSCMIKKGANMDFAKKSNLSGDTEIVSINVPRILMKTFLIGKMKELKEDDPALALAVKKIKKIKLMAVSGNGQSDMYNKFNNYLVKNDFEELMSLYSDGAKISINTKMKGDKVKNVMLGITDDDDHVYVDIISDLNLSELNKLIEDYEQKNAGKSVKNSD